LSFCIYYQVQNEKERKLKNDRYDEAVEVSQSLDQSALNPATGKMNIQNTRAESKEFREVSDSKGIARNEQSKSQSVLNRPFDEALEFSQSESEESIDTARGRNLQQQAVRQQQQQQPTNIRTMQSQQQSVPQQQPQSKLQSQQPQQSSSQQQQKKPEVSYYIHFDNYSVDFLFIANSSTATSKFAPSQ
jgi:hypothetical protein